MEFFSNSVVNLVLGHAGVEVPVHSAAGVGFTDLGAWCRGSPHGAHGFHLPGQTGKPEAYRDLQKNTIPARNLEIYII